MLDNDFATAVPHDVAQDTASRCHVAPHACQAAGRVACTSSWWQYVSDRLHTVLVVDSISCRLLCRPCTVSNSSKHLNQQLATCIWDRHGCHSLGLAPDVLQRLRQKLHLCSAQRLSGSKACKLRQCLLVCLSHVFVHYRPRHVHICAKAAAVAVYEAAPELVQLQRRDKLEARQALCPASAVRRSRA